MSEPSPTSPMKVGVISFGQISVECTIRNISAFGATLIVPSPARIPDQFVLVAGSGQKSYACNVAKRSGISIAENLLRHAQDQAIIHSTFISERIDAFLPHLISAAARGVR